ncbi:MAG: sigma-70 family RNA polymerase sigma factor [Desulfohalobiaceae bacterium]|nr:sigma-70 family RNA polymerase sigma factor [Desulfohalobiaceae bacterium]
MTDHQVHLQYKLKDYHQASYGWAVACCKFDHDKGQDVLQAAYLKILEGRAKFDGFSSFKTWLFSVIKNTAREQLRKERIRSLLQAAIRVQPAEYPDLEEEQNRNIEVYRLKVALSGLSKRQQEVLHLVFYQDLTIQEAGHVLGISTGAAARHYERGKAGLRIRLTEENDP